MTPNDRGTSVQAGNVIDARGLHCPWPALRAGRAIRDGAPFTIITDDPRASDELAVLATQHRWTCVEQPADDARAFALSPITGTPD